MFSVKFNKKSKTLLAAIIAVEVLSACSVIYIILHPHEILAKVSSAVGMTQISNEYLPAAQKIANQVGKQKPKSTELPTLLDVFVDKKGNIYAEEIDGKFLLIDEKPDFQNSKRMLGAINFVNLPLDKVLASVMLTDNLESTLGQSMTLYSVKKKEAHQIRY